jgi:hypothetical protein
LPQTALRETTARRVLIKAYGESRHR